MTGPTRADEHIGDRPAWRCRACAQPWPCSHAKNQLRAEFREFPSVLNIYMSGQMLDAARDFAASGSGIPPDLYARFLAWIRPGPGETGRPRVPGSP